MKKTKRRNKRRNKALRRRRTNAIILWIISIGLLLSMVIAFTPTLGLGRLNREYNNQDALIVNGEAISELAVARARQSRQDQLYNLASEGEAADDLQTLMLDELIVNELVRQAASSIGVSNGEVRQAVKELREELGAVGPRNDSIYLNYIRSRGFDDQSFRASLRQQLKQEKYLEGLTENIEVSDNEVQTYFEASRQSYLSEDQIVARQIVVEDQSLAEELHTKAVAGDNFAQLAKENSLEAAEQGGAIGGDEPTPVARLALPTNVANAAFGLGTSGITDVIDAAGRYHIVKVEEFIVGEPRPFDEAAEEVREDALEVKRAGVLEAELKRLRENANIEVPENTEFPYENPAVARVGEVEITRAELARATYLSPQARNFLNPDNLNFITQFLKPSNLNQLIDQELAYQGAQELNTKFFGTKGNIAQSALAHVSKDVETSEEDLQTYYEEHEGEFTIPASALTSQVTFVNQEEAEAFREVLLVGEVDFTDLESSLEEYNASFEDLGTVSLGTLEPELDTVLFEFEDESFESVLEEDWEVSEVIVVEKALEPEEEDSDKEGEEDTAEDGESDESTDEGDDGKEPEEDTAGEIEITPASEGPESIEEVTEEEFSGADEESADVGTEGAVGDEASEEDVDGTDEELVEASEEEPDNLNDGEVSEDESNDTAESSDAVAEDTESSDEASDDSDADKESVDVEAESAVGAEASEEDVDSNDKELVEASEEELDSLNDGEVSEDESNDTAESSNAVAEDAESSDEASEDAEEVSEPETIEEYVLLVATRTPERLQSLEEVQEDVEERVLNEKRNELRQAWLDELREKITVENLLNPEIPIVEEGIETEEETAEESEPSLADLFTTDPLPEDTTSDGIDFESMPPTSSTPPEESALENFDIEEFGGSAAQDSDFWRGYLEAIIDEELEEKPEDQELEEDNQEPEEEPKEPEAEWSKPTQDLAAMNPCQVCRNLSLAEYLLSYAISFAYLITEGEAEETKSSNLAEEINEDVSNPIVLTVNGKPINELELTRASQSNYLYSIALEGEAADDLQILLLDELISNELINQAASEISVTRDEVEQEIKEFREQIGAAGTRNKDIYLQSLWYRGFDEQTYRAYLREFLKQEKYLNGLVENVDISEAEVEAYFISNNQAYLSEERIKARQIVVDDEFLAEELRIRAVAGEDFLELAKEYSLEAAEQGGAIGDDEPTPIGFFALPTAIAEEAFYVGTGGITSVISVAGRFHLVKVEEFIASQSLPFDEVAEEVREDALEAKRAGVLEAELKLLRENANIEVPENTEFPYENLAVARVGEVEITRAELVRATYLDPQVSNFLSPQSISFVTEFFKPSTLNLLIDQELVYQGAQELDIKFLGTKGNIAQSVLAYISKDAEINEEEVQAYYEEYKEGLPSLEEARVEIEEIVLNAKRNELQQAWLGELREEIAVENLLYPEEPVLEEDSSESSLIDLFTTDPLPETEEDGSEETTGNEEEEN